MQATNIYFDDTLYIQQTNNHIGSNIEYSTNMINWHIVEHNQFPIQLNYIGINNKQGIVYLTTNICFNDISNSNVGPGSNAYFFIGTNNITIDGLYNNIKHTIFLNNIIDYFGLINNGFEQNNGKTNITIKNIFLDCSSSIQKYNSGSGWFCQTYYANNSLNNTLSNLITNGNITTGGGIVGDYASNNYALLNINKCYTTGNILENNCGSIVGMHCANNFGVISINSCYSSGNITGKKSGGIIGSYGGNNNGNVNINKCYSTGNIIGNNSGGIIGSYCSGLINVSDCYSSGNILGQNAGGLIGCNSGNFGSVINIINCYSTGNIDGAYAGGITGLNTAVNYGKVFISNCYSNGSINGTGSGGIIGKNPCNNNGYIKVLDCYTSGIINGINSGGIIGELACINNGSINIHKCYSIGDISGNYSGGIAGKAFGYNSSNSCFIDYCYSKGNIYGLLSGGIVGAEVGYIDKNYNPNINIQNCYSTGLITNHGGSICGGGESSNYYKKDISINIIKCYTLHGPLVSLIDISVNISFSFVEYNKWNDDNAISILQNIGSVWQVKNLNEPYVFSLQLPIIKNISIVDVNSINNNDTSILVNGFNFSNVKKLLINNVDVSFTLLSSLQILFTTNLNNNSISYLNVVNQAGISKDILLNHYLPPIITSLSSSSGTIDISYTIIIYGNNFTNNTFVIVDNSLVSCIFHSITQIEIVIQSNIFKIAKIYITNEFGNSNLVNYNFKSIPISNICFPKETYIYTNQGLVSIEKLNPDIHTIRNQKIVAITQTITNDKQLVCIKKDAICKNIPSKNTIITPNHKIFYNKALISVKELINYKTICYIKYTGEILYNVLLNNYSMMIVNNLICETLDPRNGIAKLYLAVKDNKLTFNQEQELINKYNNYVTEKQIFKNKI